MNSMTTLRPNQVVAFGDFLGIVSNVKWDKETGNVTVAVKPTAIKTLYAEGGSMPLKTRKILNVPITDVNTME